MKLFVSILFLLLAQMTTLLPFAEAFLQDDLSATAKTGRVVVGGEFVKTPAGEAKAWDGGTGWLSGMRLGLGDAFYGRKDFVLYHDLVPGTDLPVEQGTLELWAQRARPRGNAIDRDTLWQLLDDKGTSILTVAIVYPGGPLDPQLVVAELGDVWGEIIPVPPIAVGQWFHLAFTWGPRGEQDNHVYLNGQEVLPLDGIRSGNLAEVLRKTKAMKLGTGFRDDDPAYHTLFDEFRVSGEIKTTFDLSGPLLAQP